jgi:hypothetical protein
MALTEQSVIDQITILEDGQIQVRRADKVLKDGVEVASTYHRHVVVPGAALGGEDTRVSQVGAVIHTAAVIQAYRASLPTD